MVDVINMNEQELDNYIQYLLSLEEKDLKDNLLEIENISYEFGVDGHKDTNIEKVLNILNNS